MVSVPGSLDGEHRVFFALWPDTPARAALVRLSHEVAHHAHGKAPREDNLHVTIAFLGPVAAERLGVLERIGCDVAAGIAPFGLSLERVGGTGYGIAWLSCDGVPPSLASLHAALAAGLARAGFPTEHRMFRPHLTLARHCARAVHRGAVQPVRWTVERLALVESTLAAGGSRYRNLREWPLGDAPSPAARASA
jgi:RNA 2',3'-cyclic 3'-phosphodiesterase